MEECCISSDDVRKRHWEVKLVNSLLKVLSTSFNIFASVGIWPCMSGDANIFSNPIHFLRFTSNKLSLLDVSYLCTEIHRDIMVCTLANLVFHWLIVCMIPVQYLEAAIVRQIDLILFDLIQNNIVHIDENDRLFFLLILFQRWNDGVKVMAWTRTEWCHTLEDWNSISLASHPCFSLDKISLQIELLRCRIGNIVDLFLLSA